MVVFDLLKIKGTTTHISCSTFGSKIAMVQNKIQIAMVQNKIRICNIQLVLKAGLCSKKINPKNFNKSFSFWGHPSFTNLMPCGVKSIAGLYIGSRTTYYNILSYKGFYITR